MEIKNVIFENRKKMQLTQEQLATKLNVSNKTISNWERGKSYPDILIIPHLCNVLNIEVNEFFQIGEKTQTKKQEACDYKVISRFKTMMIISMVLLFFPLLSFLGTLANSSFIFIFFIVLGSIGYVFAFTAVIIVSINFYRYIEGKGSFIENVNMMKNYNLIFIYILHIVTSALIFLINKYNAIVILSIINYFLFLIVIVFLVAKNKFQYHIKQKAIYILLSFCFFVSGVILSIIKINVLGYIPIFLILVSQAINYISLFRLKEK